MNKVYIMGAFLLIATSSSAQDKNWLVESHFLIGKDNVGYKVLGASVNRKIFNIFSGYCELDLMPDEDLFSKPRFNTEFGIKARIQTNSGLYLSAGSGFAILTSTGRGLASNWQLPNTLEAGLYNELGSIGFIFKHFSNGTSSTENTGRNYIGFQVGHEF